MAITIKESQHLRIPLEDIDVATEKFTTVIGKGGYGFVYKGELLVSGKLTTVAVKRLSSNISGQGFKEFLTEIKLLCHYKHPNLISLLGFCEQGNEKILIYEHAGRGSLDKYLSCDDKATSCLLTWTQRINICIDAAQGLDYLHNHVGKFHRIIHRDIKSANILLDHSWKAMISDLGLSKIGRSNENDSYLITNACGTHGYCDPVYRDTGILTKESDVYSFGVVLFEVLCGRLCFVNVQNERRFLDRLAQRYYEEGRLNEIIDMQLKNQIGSTSLNIVADIAYQCLQNDREKRPSMSLVVEKLEEARESQRMMDKPQGTSDELSSAETDVTQWNVLQFNTASTCPFIIKCGANSNSQLVIKADDRVQEPRGGEILRVVPRPTVLETMSLEEIKEVFSKLPEALSLLALARTADRTRARYSRLYRTLALKIPALRDLAVELEKGSSAETDVTQWNVLQFNLGSKSPFIIKCGANSHSELVIKADERVQEPKGGEICRVVPRPTVLETMSLEEIKEVFRKLPGALSLLALARTADRTRARYSKLYTTLAMKVFKDPVGELEKGGRLKDVKS